MLSCSNQSFGRPALLRTQSLGRTDAGIDEATRLAYAAAAASKAEVDTALVRKMFHAADKDGTGSLCLSELGAFFVSLGYSDYKGDDFGSFLANEFAQADLNQGAQRYKGLVSGGLGIGVWASGACPWRLTSPPSPADFPSTPHRRMCARPSRTHIGTDGRISWPEFQIYQRGLDALEQVREREMHRGSPRGTVHLAPC